MVTAVGVVVLIVGLICWIGQSLTFLARSVAVKLGVAEPEEEMDPTLYILETRVQGLNDMLLTWTLPLSALLMLLEHPLWPYLGLIGGGIYVYFSGVIILSRVFLKRRGMKVGPASSERAAYVFGVIWILSALTMIALASIELSG
ncbi:MAG: hypothetical protein PVG79_05345 [Gemmatimonadales bacterium]|jgi:hypothetical protein